MPVTVLQARSRGPCSWCCKKLRLLKFRIDQNGDDEVVIRLRSRIEEISPDHLFLILPPRHISEFFRIDSTIGEGGFGTVFKAKPTPEGCKLVRRFQSNKPYAIKMVKLQKKAGLAEEIGYSLLNVSMERHREFLLGLTSSGPFENGMIGLLAAFIHPKEALYQVMELLEGPDLFDFLAERSSKLEEVKAVGLVRQMVKAVHYMHRSLGALHRDIKPENFGFIQPPVPGQPLPALKLFDVGLAWVLKSPVTEESERFTTHQALRHRMLHGAGSLGREHRSSLRCVEFGGRVLHRHESGGAIQTHGEQVPKVGRAMRSWDTCKRQSPNWRERQHRCCGRKSRKDRRGIAGRKSRKDPIGAAGRKILSNGSGDVGEVAITTCCTSLIAGCVTFPVPGNPDLPGDLAPQLARIGGLLAAELHKTDPCIAGDLDCVKSIGLSGTGQGGKSF